MRNYKIQQHVEVKSDNEESVWFLARVKSSNDTQVVVHYDDKSLADESKNHDCIRPCPKKRRRSKSKYHRLMEVDYLSGNSWISGVVCTLLDGNKYSVYSCATHVEEEVEQINLRVHFDYDSSRDSWIDSPLNLEVENRRKLRMQPLPLRKDWREEGIIKNPRKQLGGTCYAYASAAALEARWAAFFKVLEKDMPYFSVQQLIDCKYSKGYTEGKAGNVIDHAIKNGIFSEAEYPALTKEYNPEMHERMGKKFERLRRKIGEPKYKFLATMIQENVSPEVMKEEIAYGGVVIAYIDAYMLHTCQDGEIWTSRRPVEEADEEDLHWILVVGYDVQDGIPYYICKNSWGNTAEDVTYFYLAEGECGIHETMIFPLIKE